MDEFVALRVYMKPLLPGQLQVKKDMVAALRASQKELLKRIKKQLTLQQVFSKRAKVAMAKAIKVKIKESSLLVVSRHPGFEWLIKGRRRAQMSWLTRAKRPIPIITEKGELIFRNATARSMKRGPLTGPRAGSKPGWIHPGRQPSDFVTRAKDEARKYLKEQFAFQFRKLVSQHMRSKQKGKRR